ncbi:MAG: ABC transporter substrate-binding protein [Reyranellaceae bacterium]
MGLARLIAMTAIAVSLAMPTAAAKTLRWASADDALTLDPHSRNDGPTSAMAQHIYDALIQRDPSLRKMPNLALSWKPTADDAWQFKLRPGVTFSDGSPFTSADVVFSLRRAMAPTSDFKDYLSSVKEVKADDPLTVTVYTRGPNPILPDQLTYIFMMSRSWAQKHDVVTPTSHKDRQDSFAVRNAMGTGPFVVRQRDPGIRTVLARNPGYWDAADFADYPDEIVYTPIREPTSRVAALLSGQIDFLLDAPLQDIGRIKATAGLRTLQTAQVRTLFLGLDVGAPALKYGDVAGTNPFADPRVREAMLKAIDVEAIHRKVMGGFSAPAGVIAPPAVHGWTKALDARPAHDLAGARKLMADAGYARGFKVTLDCPDDRYANDEAICRAIVGMLAQIGIGVDLQARSKTLHFPKLQKRDSSFYLLGWGVPTLDSHHILTYLYRTGGSWNFTGLSDKALDALILAMSKETDSAKRDGMIADAWKIAKASNVYLPIHHPVIVWSMSEKVTMPIVATGSPNFKYAVIK